MLEEDKLHYVERARDKVKAELVRAQELYEARRKTTDEAIALMNDARDEIRALQNALVDLGGTNETKIKVVAVKDPFVDSYSRQEGGAKRLGSD
ncbi:hypothetical protein SEA_FORZA_14 [Gordonia phage Forza]|uniref:Uncharacterized protein n=1 Tax=Gordonia phage Forza TaxID=2571247 RepID=A0A650EXW8_9CAUD|nr:hypothetical protein PP303_gp014 [Gordonia phage Forza]QEM41483.1 hypothetical protein SEA_BOOPY_14 [Gordonia phage Boopy]QGT55007.1 hypothetical protein SEA_FORZA_14 [Gordonia phage Forza]UXE04157.1 hypothetical protein SEA_BLUENGOLD_13 [Gordonia phage BlueNGold]WBF03795.1 hypothetical protein SEA_MAREELIH_12 [Gordonia phage Mareelih]